MVKIGGPLLSLEAHGWFGGYTYVHRGVNPAPYPIGITQGIHIPYRISAFGLRPYPQFIAQYYNAMGWVYQRRRTWHGIVWSVIRPPISVNKHSSKQSGRQWLFASAVSAWRNFAQFEKDVYNRWTYPARASGYNRFIRWFMRMGESMPMYWGSLDRSVADPVKIQDAAVMVDSPHVHYPFDFLQYQLFNAVLHQGVGFPPNPLEGQQFWRSDENKQYTYDGVAWKVVYPSAGGTDTRIATVIVAADGTGDYTDVQDGIDALPAGGGLVFVKDGTYILPAPVVIAKSNVTLQGQSAATLLKLDDNAGASIISVDAWPAKYDNIIIRDLSLDGNQAGGNQAEGIYLRPNSGVGCQIINCRITECYYRGIYAGYTPGIIVKDNWVTNCRFGGISVTGSNGQIILNNHLELNGSTSGSSIFVGMASNMLIDGNYILGNDAVNGGAGIDMQDLIDSKITNNSINSGYIGVRVDTYMSGSYRITIGHNAIQDTLYRGITSQYYGIVIIGNTLRSTGKNAIYVGGDSSVVMGNIISSVQESAVIVAGYQINVSGNTFDGYMQEAIVLSNAMYCSVSDNVFVWPAPSPTNVYTGIYLRANGANLTRYNIVQGNNIMSSTPSNKFRFGIAEMDENSNLNYITNNILRNNVTKDVYLRGPLSKSSENFYF